MIEFVFGCIILFPHVFVQVHQRILHTLSASSQSENWQCIQAKSFVLFPSLECGSIQMSHHVSQPLKPAKCIEFPCHGVPISKTI